MERPRSASGLDVPPDWARAAARIADGEARRVLVLGARDVGKSALCRVILDVAAAAGRAVALLDADVGQKMVGPPACVTLGRPAPDCGLALAALAFIGSTSPVQAWGPTMEALRKLAAESEAKADALVINTGGLLAGPGRRLKEGKIAALAPDLVVALGAHPALDALVGANPALPWLRVPSASHARRKGEGERRRARREAFQHYFAGASRWTSARAELQPELPPGALAAGLLVGLADAAGRDVALGIVLRADEAVVSLLTPVPRGDVASLRPGALILDGNFRETARTANPSAQSC